MYSFRYPNGKKASTVKKTKMIAALESTGKTNGRTLRGCSVLKSTRVIVYDHDPTPPT